MALAGCALPHPLGALQQPREFSPAPSAPSFPRGELTLRLTDAALLEQRLIVDRAQPDQATPSGASSRLFAAYGYGDRGLEYLSGGISTAELTVGTVKLQGLLRELYRPTRFAPSSDVYREPAALALDASLAPTTRLGLQLQPWRAVPALFATVRDDAPESVGLAAEYGAGPVTVAAILRTGVADGEAEDAVWYTEYPRFPGGRLYHAAAQLRLEGEGVRISGMSAVSGGPLVEMSTAARLHGLFRAGALRLSGLWAVTRPGYVTPDGRFWRDAGHGAAAIRVGRTRGPALELEGSHRVAGAPLRDGRVASSRSEVRSRLGTHDADWGRQRVTAAAGTRWRESRDDRGRSADAVSAEATLAAERPLGAGSRLVVRARADGRRDWADGERESDRLETRFSIGGPGLTFDSRVLVIVRDADASYSGRVELRARVGALRLYLRAATLEEVTGEDVAQLRSVPLTIALGGSLGFTVPWQPGRFAPAATPATVIPPTLQPAAPRAPE